MNRVNAKKLLDSKWTAVSPQRREKHFTIVAVDYDDDGAVSRCVLEAVLTRRSFAIDWRDLKDSDTWKSGWV